MPPQVGEFAARMGRDLSGAALVPVSRRCDYHVPLLRFRTPDAVKPLVSPVAIEALARLAPSFPASPRDAIFVGRLDVPTRHIVDRDGLRAQLAARGIREVLPERLKAGEAIQAFAAADRVMLAIGSAKFNLAFCAPGTRVVGIVPEGYSSGGVTTMLRHLCALRGLRLGLYETSVRNLPPGGSPIGADLAIEGADLARIEWLSGKL